MNSPTATTTRNRPGDYIVARPRVTDALGLVLRGAFDGTASVPEDMVVALSKIDHASNH